MYKFVFNEFLHSFRRFTQNVKIWFKLFRFVYIINLHDNLSMEDASKTNALDLSLLWLFHFYHRFELALWSIIFKSSIKVYRGSQVVSSLKLIWPEVTMANGKETENCERTRQRKRKQNIMFVKNKALMTKRKNPSCATLIALAFQPRTFKEIHWIELLVIIHRHIIFVTFAVSRHFVDNPSK